MSSNQDPNSHIMYQPTYAYQATQSMGTWGQPPAQQAFAYTAYPQNDRTTYQEAPAYNSQQYPQMQYGGGTADSNADYYRSSGYYATQQATNQWPQQSYTTFTTAPAATQPMFSAPGYSGTEREQPRAGATSYAAAAQLPNMSRPPPNIKRDNGDNTFHGANLSMLETPAAVSAAYTATWVSNTSSIPPDLKEEPELFVGLATDAAVFPPNLTEQFGHLSMGGKNDKRKGDERRTPREEQSPAVKELTWQERINRANAQKERAEKRGGAERSMFEGGDNQRPPRDFGGQRGGAGGTRPQRGGNSGPNRGGTPGNRQQSGNNGMIWKNDNGEGRENGQQDWNNRGGNNRPLPGIMRGQEMPMMFHPGQAMMFPQRMPYGPPRGYMNNVQDERFKNTWLDVNQFGCPMPYGPMPFPMNGGMFRGGRGGFSRGRGGFGRGRGEYYNRPRDNNSRQSEEQKPLDSPVPASSVENVDSPAPGTPSAEPQTA